MRPVTVVVAILAAVAGCRSAGRELAAGPSGPAGARALAEALADRFGPIDREAGFDMLRPRLAAGALVPSRVFDDPSPWRTRGEGWRAVDLDGYATGGVYRIGARVAALAPRAPGQYRGRVQLRRIAEGRYEWAVTEELALGPVRPSDLARAADALLRGAEHATGASARAEIGSALPRALAALGQLLHVERLALSRDPGGATSLELAVRLDPAGIRAFAPRYAAFLRKYATPMRTSVAVTDAGGAAWWTLTGADNLWTLRLRVRDGSLVPLEGASGARLPGELVARGDFETRMGRFKVGARGVVARVALARTETEKGLWARFLQEPDWSLPFLVETFLHSPLRYPFEVPGSEVGWALRESPSGTMLHGVYRARVRENWILRWLGGMTANAVDEFRRGAEAEADRFHRECLLALRDDLVEISRRR